MEVNALLHVQFDDLNMGWCGKSNIVRNLRSQQTDLESLASNELGN
jgi:hypothetical protein